MDQVAEKLARTRVPELDELLGTSFKVLDQGFVRLVDYMGTDASVVQAARVSYGEGTKTVHEDRGLLRFLMRHRHTTPFEMCELKLHVRVPMDHWRQWIRHRTANVNEYSTRYSIAINECQTTAPTEWRLQAAGNRQGSDGYLPEDGKGEHGSYHTKREAAVQDFAREVYKERIAAGIAREQARKDLPLSNYTEAYWKIDLHNLLHFLSLRMDTHAQVEIRSYANVIGHEIVRRWVPMIWEAFQDYRLNAKFYSRLDLDVIKALVAGDEKSALAFAEDFGWLKEDKDTGERKKNRERSETEGKLAFLGLSIPWN